MTIDWLHRLQETGLTQKQAEAIVSGPEKTYVTRDYLDARLSQLLNDITWRLIGLAVISITIVGLLDKFVRP